MLKLNRIILDSGVGKSSIVQRFVANTYHDSIAPTIGASFMGKTLQVGDMTCKFQIWDTAGQEKYRGLAPMYYRNAGAAIIVYDITNQQSFELVRVWVRELQRHGPEKICIAIFGNKMDLEELREVQTEEGSNYAKEIGAIFGETSAKTANNIEDLFIDIRAATENDRRPDEKKLVVDERREWEEVYGWSISRKDMVEEKHHEDFVNQLAEV
ncbi:putative ras-related protein [Apostichopus japonicus]|uniref:Putative ras-related protein n=1 Tax=Stichopus japonicus TaxID=307972 RepID=A0A2G8JW67_STIJA|nr:putative ras-related protein [Apostichopus japonicus]